MKIKRIKRLEPDTELTNDELLLNQVGELKALVSRTSMTGYLGKMYGTDRDYYQALGWSANPVFENFYQFYSRQDVARRIVNAYPDATWATPPEVTDDQETDEETPFQIAWNKLVKEQKVFHYLHRADRLAGIGRYGGLLLGFSHTKDMKDPIRKNANNRLLFLRPTKENSLFVDSYESSIKNAQYNKPLYYRIQDTPDEGIALPTFSNQQIHFSRIIHIAENLEENDVYGVSRLKAIFNRLMGIDLVAGGGAEMFWRGAFPGLAVIADKDAEFMPADKEKLRGDLDNYIHDLQRTLLAQGIDVKTLAPNISDPNPTLKMLLMLVSIDTGIPLRILTGSERGELASSQDEKNWDKKIHSRNINFAEPNILRPFVDRNVEAGVLPEPFEGDYDVVWQNINELPEKEKADVGKIKAETLKIYFTSGAEDLYSFEQFLKDVMNYPQNQIDAMNIDDLRKELDDAEEGERQMEEERLEAERIAEAGKVKGEHSVKEKDFKKYGKTL